MAACDGMAACGVRVTASALLDSITVITASSSAPHVATCRAALQHVVPRCNILRCRLTSHAVRRPAVADRRTTQRLIEMGFSEAHVLNALEVPVPFRPSAVPFRPSAVPFRPSAMGFSEAHVLDALEVRVLLRTRGLAGARCGLRPLSGELAGVVGLTWERV
jgi:hypothetical protein